MIRSFHRSVLLLAILGISAGLSAQESLSLSGALENAMSNNYGIIVSRAGTDIASINNDWGNAGRYPTIGFSASDNNSYNPGSETYTNRFMADLGLNWILFDGFRVKFTKEQLEELETRSRGQLAVLVENTIEDVVLGYYNVLLQKEQLAVLKTVMDLSADRFEYEKKKQELGGSVTYNVLQAQNVYLSDKASFMNQEVVVRNAIRDLNFMMGMEPERRWNFSEEFRADTSEYTLADLLSRMKSSNQVLQNQYTNLLLKEKATAIQRSAYAPTLSLGTGIETSGTGTRSGGDPFNTSGSFSPYGNLRLSYDIYSAGVRRRSMEIARINEEIARVEIEEMEHALTNQLFNLYDYYMVRVELLKVADENLEAAGLNMNISEEKYRSGVINSFNYRDVQLIYLNTSIRRLQAVYNLISSRTQLTRITGGFLGTDPE
jgi:outer membrane protein TolC